MSYLATISIAVRCSRRINKIGDTGQTLGLQVRIDQKGDNFRWRIVGSTDQYADLHGSGDGFGIPFGETGVTDVYIGGLHID